MIKPFIDVSQESTCQKRITICEIYDESGVLLSRESNRCYPKGLCGRLGLTQEKSNYDIESSCNWIHAEINAISNLPSGYNPFKSVLYGHDFYCDACESALKAVGVKLLEINKARIIL